MQESATQTDMEPKDIWILVEVVIVQHIRRRSKLLGLIS